jgi:hypothetical protein
MTCLMKTGYGSICSGLCIRRMLMPETPNEDIHY